jgi:O-antigen/teichoic acid export membrane protein
VRLGQTSVVHFGSELLASVAGFVATLYIARELGSSTLGTYALFIAVLIWLKTGVGSGLHQAINKRVSEVGDSARYLGAGIVIQAALFGVVALVLFVFRPYLDWYLGFEGTLLLILALAVVLAFSLVSSTLHGEQKVHVAALLRPLDRVVRSSVQLAVVFLGIIGGGVAGLVWGYVAGAVVAVAAGAVLLSLRPKWPDREQISSVVDFTRYSWLSGIEERSFSAMDTVVLGVFVSQSFIGYYEVAWNLASLLAIFGNSISESLFPTISELESNAERESVRDLLNNGLAYTGLFLIPGFVGVVLVGEPILGLYGSEFEQAGTVLAILVVARLIYAYEAQFIMTLNAIDYPDIAFRVNLVFVASNIVLNVVLVYLYGWVGAAVGTATAAFVGLIVAYYALTDVIDLKIPVGELARQLVAAIAMGVVLYPTRGVVLGLLETRIVEALLLVSFGAGVYFAVLVVLSTRFRTTVRNNIPI